MYILNIKVFLPIKGLLIGEQMKLLPFKPFAEREKKLLLQQETPYSSSNYRKKIITSG